MTNDLSTQLDIARGREAGKIDREGRCGHLRYRFPSYWSEQTSYYRSAYNRSYRTAVSVAPNQPGRLLARFPIIDTHNGEYDIIVADEVTDEAHTFVVRGRNGLLLDERADGASAMRSALNIAGWLQHL